MFVQEALSISGTASIAREWNRGSYVKQDEGGVLWWYTEGDNEERQGVSLDSLLGSEWIPLHLPDCQCGNIGCPSYNRAESTFTCDYCGNHIKGVPFTHSERDYPICKKCATPSPCRYCELLETAKTRKMAIEKKMVSFTSADKYSAERDVVVLAALCKLDGCRKGEGKG